jgi:hypothetical protein
MPKLKIGDLIKFNDEWHGPGARPWYGADKGSFGLVYNSNERLTRFQVLLNNGLRGEVTARDLDRKKVEIIATKKTVEKKIPIIKTQ